MPRKNKKKPRSGGSNGNKKSGSGAPFQEKRKGKGGAKSQSKPAEPKNPLMNLHEAIVKIVSKDPEKVWNYEDLSREMRIGNAQDRLKVRNAMDELVESDVLKENVKGRVSFNSASQEFEGIVDGLSNGSAYIISPDKEKDVYVHVTNINRAMHGDKVRVRMAHGRKKPEGVIIGIVERARKEFIGTIQLNKNFAFLVPDNQKITIDLFIPLAKLNGARDGQKAIAEITDWPIDSKNPFGRVIEVLGDATDNDVVMHSILFEYDLPSKFPEHVERVAEKIEYHLDEAELKKRRDFRQITTFTIDPHDAKDFDDALSFQKLENGNYEIGVHIADVTHYMAQGDELDSEAYDRATSVYLVDRVVPMLPEKLSNGVCSLRPHEEKFTFSAVFEMDEEANIVNEWFGKTVIYSDRRFTYEEAQEIIETGVGELSEEILTMDKLAKKLRGKRFKKGAISFDRVEVKFKLAEDDATPIGVYFKEAKDSNKLIEEFMLLANKQVATFIGKAKKGGKARTFVYRIHDQPNPDKFNQFANFVGQFGYNIKGGNEKNIAKSLNTLLKEVHGKKEGNMIETLAVRTMAKAEYSTHNIGHYGLAFEYYSHFTSPIRRYPDVMVHRLLQHYLDGGKSVDENEYEEYCIHSSKREKLAADAERDSIKYKQVEFMSKRIGVQFEAIISGVTDWGIYAEVIENLCEGLISIRTLDDDVYKLDQENYCIVGTRHGKKYQMGDKILIEIKNADLAKRQLDYILIESLEEH